MSAEHDPDTAMERLRALYERKVRAELDDADEAAGGAGVGWSGEPLASVAAVKGRSGPAEQRGDPAFSGADGDALQKALAALGEERTLFLTCSRPSPAWPREILLARLRIQLASVDPSLVIATDAEGAQDIAEVLGIPVPRAGVRTRARGIAIVAVDGLEASLADERRKAAVWRQFRTAFS